MKLSFTIITSGLAMAISYLITFFLTPYITEEFGAEAYGYITLAKQVVSYAGVLTIALNSYATRFIAVAYHKKDYNKSDIYFSSVLVGDLVVSLALLAIFFLGVWKLEYMLNISTWLIEQVKVLFLMIGIHFAISTAATVYNVGAYISDQLIRANLLKGCAYITEAIALIVFYKRLAPKLWYVGMGSVISVAFISLSNIWICKKYTPQIKYSHAAISINAIKEMIGNGIWNSLNSLGNMLNSGLDLLITNLMLNDLAMGQIAYAKTISSMFYVLLQIVSQPFQPRFLKEYANKEREDLIFDLKRSMTISGVFSNLAFAGFVALGKAYYDLWIPTQDTQFITNLTIVTLLGIVVEGAIYPLYYVYTLTIKNKLPSLVTILGGLLNIGGMYFLLSKTRMGAYAIVITTTVIMTFISFVFNPIYMTECLGIKRSTFYPLLLRHCISCVAMTILFCQLIKLLPTAHNWFTLVFNVICCIVIGCPLHFLIVGTFRRRNA